MFENRVLRKIFKPKRDKVTGEWRKLHDEKLLNLRSLPSTGCGKLASFFIQTAQFKKGS
jgi:hypothetical protein